MNQALNPITMPLQGTSLIEASAGTGKTFNIAALFARLILLEQLPVDAILVVTFTTNSHPARNRPVCFNQPLTTTMAATIRADQRHPTGLLATTSTA